MPVLRELQDRLLILTLIGSYDYGAPVRAVVQAMNDPAFEPGTTLLIDARQSTVSRSSEEFRQRAFWMESLLARGLAPHFAMVINSQLHQFGLARMAATHVELRGMESGIFRDFDEASTWLSWARASSSIRTISRYARLGMQASGTRAGT